MRNLFQDDVALEEPGRTIPNLFRDDAMPEVNVAAPEPEPGMFAKAGAKLSESIPSGEEAQQFGQDTKDYWADQAGMLVGGAEAAAGLATGSYTAPLSGLAGLAGLVAGAVPGGDSPTQKAMKWMENTQNLLMYKPQTEIGQQTLKQAEVPFKMWDDFWQGEADKIFARHGSTPYGAAIATSIGAAMKASPFIWARRKVDIHNVAEVISKDPSRAERVRSDPKWFEAEVKASRFGGHPEDYFNPDGTLIPDEVITGDFRAITDRTRIAEDILPKGKKLTRAQKRVTNKAKAASAKQQKILDSAMNETKVNADKHLVEIEKQIPAETAMREQQQARIAEIGIDAFLAEQTISETPQVKPEIIKPQPIEPAKVESVKAEPPSVELINVETKPVTDLFVDDWDAPLNEELFINDEVVDAASPEAVIQVRKNTVAQKYDSEEAVIGMEVHAEKFKTKKAAQAKIDGVMKSHAEFEPGEIKIIKVKNHWRMAMEIDQAPLAEASEAIAETVKNLPELMLDEELTSADFLDLDDREMLAVKAEEQLMKLIGEVNEGLVIERPETAPDVAQNWEQVLADEGMGMDQMESVDPLDEALSWEEVDASVDVVDRMYSNGVELYSGIPIHLLKDLFKQLNSKRPTIDRELSSVFSVTAPFEKLGWSNLGQAVKVRHEVELLYGDEALRTINKLTSLRNSKKELGDLSLIREKQERFRGELTEKQKAGVKILDEFYDIWAQRFKEVRGLTDTFPDSLIARNDKKIALIERKIANTDDPTKVEKWTAEVQQLHTNSAKLSKMNYSPVLGEWFEEMASVDMHKTGKLFSANPLKRRKTVGYQDILDTGYIKVEDLNASTLMANYARRASKKYALIKIREAAIQDGAMTYSVTKAKKLGMMKVNAQSMPLFKGLYGDPRWLMTLENMQLGYHAGNKVRRFFSTVKGMQFLNVAYLGFNNVKQGTMLGSYTSAELPIHMQKAWKSMTTWDQHFYDAKANGISGNPMGDTIKSWDAKVAMAQSPVAGKVFKAVIGNGNLVKNAYNIMHNVAWNFDTLTRMVSYHYLLDQGHSPREAAQLSALFHGDYSNVPLKTRQFMTMGLFTPTYKVAMTKLYFDMMRSGYDLASGGSNKWFQKVPGDDNSYSKGKSRKKSARMLKALTVMAGVSMGFDYWMTNNGWDRDIFGVRYMRVVDTPEGKRELVFMENSPFNLPIKMSFRLYNSFTEPSGTPAVENLFRVFSYEFHPIARTVMVNLANNKDNG